MACFTWALAGAAFWQEKWFGTTLLTCEKPKPTFNTHVLNVLINRLLWGDSLVYKHWTFVLRSFLNYFGSLNITVNGHVLPELFWEPRCMGTTAQCSLEGLADVRQPHGQQTLQLLCQLGIPVTFWHKEGCQSAARTSTVKNIWN